MKCPYCQSERVITSDRVDKLDFCLECQREFEGRSIEDTLVDKYFGQLTKNYRKAKDGECTCENCKHVLAQMPTTARQRTTYWCCRKNCPVFKNYTCDRAERRG